VQARRKHEVKGRRRSRQHKALQTFMDRDASTARRDAELAVGDQLLPSATDFRPPSNVARSRKFAPELGSPYNVVVKVSSAAYKLQLLIGTNAHPVFYSSPLRSYDADVTGEGVSAVPLPLRVE
jgi:hypothetical protein